MSDRVRIITACYGLRTPHADGERLYRFDARSELALLEDYDRQFFRAAYEGQLVYVPKTCCYRFRGEFDGPPIAVAAPAIGGTARPTASTPYSERSRSRQDSSVWVTALRVLAFLAGAGMVLSGLILILFAAPSVLSSEDDVSTGYAFGITGAVILATGLGLVRLSQRALLQFALLFTGIGLAIGGIQALIFAIPISRMRQGDIDPERALLAMLVAGGVLLPLGIAIAAIAVIRWLRNPGSRRQRPVVARWSAIVFGGLLLLAGTSVAGTIPATSEDFTANPFDAAALGIAITMFLVPGAILCFHGLTMARPRLNGPFRFFPAAPMFGLAALAIALGATVVAVEEPIVWLMTSAHAGAALLPALALIALASRGGLRMRPPVAGISHRQLWLALAVGIAVVTTVAGTLDGLIAQAFSTAVLASSGAFDGLRTFEAVADAMQFPDLYLSRWQSALLLLTIVAVVAPVMEEGFKAIGVSLILPRLPTQSAALTLGVAVGAGFGVTEASLYGLGGLQFDSSIDWWALMLLRAGATTMHALNTGLLGLALYFGAAERRYRRGFALYLAAVALHGLWNTLAVLAGSRVIFEFESLSDRGISMLAFGVFAVLGLAMLAILYVVVRRVYQASPKLGPGESPPAAPVGQPAFEPWIGV